MKKYINFLFFLVLVLCITVIIDFVAGFYLNKNKWKSIPKMEHAVSATEDIAIFGASRASHHYISNQIKDSLGLSCYNYGIDGKNLYLYYGILSLIDKYAPNFPKIIILELSTGDIAFRKGYETETINSFHTIPKETEAIKELIRMQGDSYQFALISSLYRHNSLLAQYILYTIRENKQDVNNGYEPLYGIFGGPAVMRAAETNEIEKDKLRVLFQFIDICHKHNAKLVFVTSPYCRYKTEEHLWEKEIDKIAVKHNIPFWKFEEDKYFISHPELFNESSHLNDSGAIEFTKQIIQKLKICIASN